MSRRVEGRAFLASGPEKENACSPMDVHGLEVFKMYQHTKNEVSRSRLSIVKAQAG